MHLDRLPRPDRHRLIATVACAFAAAAAGCADPDPREPTWFGGVQALINFQCGRCHGAVPAEDAIADFRLDRYVAGDATTLDAHDYLAPIRLHAVLRQAPAMPLNGALDADDRDLLDRWVLAGGPKGTRANQLPTVTMSAPASPPAQVDQGVTLSFTAADADRDGLAVAIELRDLSSGDVTPVIAGLGAGRHDLSLDTGQLASGIDVAVVATADDGYADDPAANRHEIVLVSSVRVDHGARGTAPTVRVLEPNGGATLIGQTTIAWTASDPDAGEVLTFDLDLLRVAADGTTTVVAPIVHGLTGTTSHAWDTTAIPATDAAGPIPYRVRVTATDRAVNVRADDSDGAFTVVPPVVSTTLTWADVKPIFVTYCKACHGEPARTPALDGFRFDKYDAADAEPPANGDLGVYEKRAVVYQRLVSAMTMPPAAQPQPSAADRMRVGEWILAGAPRNGGMSDQPPTVVWTTPNDSAVVRTTSAGAITLVWSASDPEGGALTGALAYAPLQAAADQTAFCDGALAGWTPLPVAIGAGTLAWTAPATGYYCLRATATDPTAHTTVRVALRPVRFRVGGP